MRCCFWPDMLGDCIVLLLVGCEVVVRGECSSLLYELSNKSRLSRGESVCKGCELLLCFLGVSGCVVGEPGGGRRLCC
jgi:hypothetical protein